MSITVKDMQLSCLPLIPLGTQRFQKAYMSYHLSIFKQNIITHHSPKSQLGPPHTATFDDNYWRVFSSKYSSALIFAIVLAILTVANVTPLL